MYNVNNVGGIGEPAYDVKSSIICQRNYCERNNLPFFAPSDGVCFNCHNNIFRPHTCGDVCTGIPTFKAGCQLITSCPHCNYSFCE